MAASNAKASDNVGIAKSAADAGNAIPPPPLAPTPEITPEPAVLAQTAHSAADAALNPAPESPQQDYLAQLHQLLGWAHAHATLRVASIDDDGAGGVIAIESVNLADARDAQAVILQSSALGRQIALRGSGPTADHSGYACYLHISPLEEK